MNRYLSFQILFFLSVIIILISGRALYYDELNDDSNTKLSAIKDADLKNPQLEQSNLFDNNDNAIEEDDDDNQVDDASFDSYEERKFHQRSAFPVFHHSTTISPDTRQALMDILQKAFDQGWRPSLKHYNPSTRFGRHRR